MRGFASKERETGLYYNRYRYCDPSGGRFVSKDPIGLAGGVNVYQYAPNPVHWIDPLGLTKCPCADDFEKILADEGVVTGRHGDLRRIGGATRLTSHLPRCRREWSAKLGITADTLTRVPRNGNGSTRRC
nr:RHS repeat-associated core domain-containing protein [Burkholderia seminalis]